MQSLYDKAERFVKETYKSAGRRNTIPHLERTVYWVRLMKPDADEGLLIAAIYHDIERAVFGDWVKGSTNKETLRRHGQLSAEIIGGFLSILNAESDFIDRVKMLVSMHEFNGDGDHNILIEADCMSYFETQASTHAEEWPEQGVPKDLVLKKFEFMYSRVQSRDAKKVIAPWFKKAVSMLKGCSVCPSPFLPQ
jgi:hypothetical protein